MVEQQHLSLDYDFARNVVKFGVDNGSLSHTNNWKITVLVLDEDPTQSINDSTGASKKQLGITFSNANTKFYLSLHYNGD